MAQLRTRLREARLEAGLTQAQVAGRLGVPRPNVARWEEGSQLPRVDNALKLAEACGTTVERVWTCEPNNKPNNKRGRAAPTAGPVTTSEVPDAMQ